MKAYKLNEIENKRILGRNVKSAGSEDKALALFWGASALEICVKAKEVWINISSDYNNYENWVAVEINGFQTERFMAPKTAQWFCVARNINPEKENLISIIKDTQPMPGDFNNCLLINQVGLDEEGKFSSVPERPLKIEFIGDSITSGEGLAGNPDEAEWITQWFCASKTYARQTAKAVNADWSVLSQCGWGICWGWDGNLNNALPLHYSNVCSVVSGDFQKSLGAHDQYNFGDGSDFVVLNLGTNDNGAFFQPPWKDEKGVEHILKTDSDGVACKENGDVVAAEVKRFLMEIKKCNPKAKIIWTWGMMKLVAIPPYITKGIEAYKAETGDSEVYTLVYDPMEDVEKCPEDKGSRGHPGSLTHKLAAQKLIKLINELK